MIVRIKKNLPFLLLVLLMPYWAFSQQPDGHLNKVVSKLEKGKLVTGIWVQSLSLSNAMSIIEYNGFPSQEEALTKPMIDFVLMAILAIVIYTLIGILEEAR